MTIVINFKNLLGLFPAKLSHISTDGKFIDVWFEYVSSWLNSRYYIHPDSPQTGAQWMKQSILFNKVKITNNPMQNPEQILLNSMHRYIPRLHIIEASDDCSIRSGPFSTFVFDETAFIAVTAYQNDRVRSFRKSLLPKNL